MVIKIDLSVNRDKDELALEEPLSRAGLYTIADAVEVIKREADVNIYDHLIKAVRSGALPTYEPNSTKRYIYGKEKNVRDFHEEVFWQDLNIWLEVNERLISYRFPNPNGKSSAKAKAVGYETNGPWWKKDPKDPEPDYSWYTPARYFARELVKDDSKLLIKRDILAKKTADSLAIAGIYKRGGKKELQPSTVKKAFSNVTFEQNSQTSNESFNEEPIGSQ